MKSLYKAKQNKAKNNNFVHRMLHFHKCCFPNICVTGGKFPSTAGLWKKVNVVIYIIYNIVYFCLCMLRVIASQPRRNTIVCSLTPNQRRLACFARRLEKQKNGFLDNVVSCQLFCARKCCHLRIGAGRNITSVELFLLSWRKQSINNERLQKRKKERKKKKSVVWRYIFLLSFEKIIAKVC